MRLSTLRIFGICIFLSLVASLLPLEHYLPTPLAYFGVALLSAFGTLAANSPGKAVHGAPARAAGNRETGHVKWFNAGKGFGFITRDNGEDVFVHFRSINGNGHRVLRDGQRVEFAVTQGSKGPQAEDVTALS
jgi:cold shock protein